MVGFGWSLKKLSPTKELVYLHCSSNELELFGEKQFVHIEVIKIWPDLWLNQTIDFRNLVAKINCLFEAKINSMIVFSLNHPFDHNECGLVWFSVKPEIVLRASCASMQLTQTFKMVTEREADRERERKP